MELNLNFTANDMQRFGWFTPYQRRDDLIELYCACSKSPITTNIVSHIKKLGLEEQARRKILANSTGEFVECPYCKGYHNQLENTDKLCESREWTVHILRWDIEHKLII